MNRSARRRLREVIITHCSALARPSPVTKFSFWSPSMGKTFTNHRGSGAGTHQCSWSTHLSRTGCGARIGLTLSRHSFRTPNSNPVPVGSRSRRRIGSSWRHLQGGRKTEEINKNVEDSKWIYRKNHSKYN